jgi:uncharacterized protein YcnI
MRSLKTLLGAAVLVVATAGPAAAHVTVQPSEATQGGYAKLAFRVPNEEATANTTKLEVQLPADAKFRSVATKPLPGWTVTRTDTTITWSGGTIAPGEFQEFEISVGPLPSVDQLVFKAVQTYDDGDVVRWIEPATPGGEEPEHPAPTLHLVAGSAEGDDHGAAVTTTTAAGETAAPAPAAASEDDGDGDGKVVGAYVVGVAGLALAAVALVQGRRKQGS